MGNLPTSFIENKKVLSIMILESWILLMKKTLSNMFHRIWK
jgi:hypothetical protein